MNLPNHITLDAIARMQIGEIVALSAETLAQLQQDVDDHLRKAKQMAAWFDGALQFKYGEQAKTARLAAEKDFGAVRFLDGNVTIVADLPKKVDWDQRELADLVERIKTDGENPLEYIDVSLKVSERKYGAWPVHIRRAFESARTVRAGLQSFKLIANDRGDA
jgi:hypothetical protein